MRKEPSGHIYMHAQQFFRLAEHAFNDVYLLSTAPYAITANYAFCVEILLKACDPKLEYLSPAPEDDTEADLRHEPADDEARLVRAAIYCSNISGHDLVKIFEKLDQKTATKVSQLFEEQTGEQILPLLEECRRYFIQARYPYDKGNRIGFDITKVRLLATGLMGGLPNWNKS